MAGKEGSTRRGKKASTGRRSRRGVGEEPVFSMGHCTSTSTQRTPAATGLSLGRCTANKPTGEKGASSRRPSTTAKPVPAADEEGCPLKRKPSGECEALGISPEQELPVEHWAYALYNPPAPTFSDKPKDRLAAVQPVAVDLFAEDAELRKRVKSVLLSFPESHALAPVEFEQAVDRVVRESKPETASVAAPGMDRLEDDVISVLLIMVKKPAVEDLPGVQAGPVFPPGWIHDRKKYLDEQCQPEKKTIGHDMVLVDKVRVDLLTKGYVEVHEDYMEEDPDFDPYVHEGRVPLDYNPDDFAPADYDGEVMLFV